ncbi:MAG: SUMF1/EgtB/PvdO family nonheme iron enzyme [Caldilineaceae bacterium]|nr:SUMF1/EgtB/PvdO family nonheme iron enzyme [Caldilineaceae bacterium]
MNTLSAYSDFLIEVTKSSEQHYLVVVRSNTGEARQVSLWPFPKQALENELRKVEVALFALSPSLLTPLALQEQPLQPERVVQTFGSALFDFLFAGETRTLYYESLREAMHHARHVRLKVSIHDPILAALPWEFLYDARRRDFVCLDPHTSLVRYTELPQTPPPLTITPPLHILAVVADPIDMATRLDVAEEQRRITAATAPLVEQGLVRLTWFQGQTWRALQRLLRTPTTPCHVFHFIGHGGFDEARHEGFIVLTDDAQRSHRLYATQLARLLARQRGTLQLVLLNACDGARMGHHNLLASTAATLIHSGIPAVLAMQYAITNPVAIEFAHTFYEALADNLPVDTAVAEARNALNFGNAASVEWGIPVLYMRATDGRLFSVADPAHPKQPSPTLTTGNVPIHQPGRAGTAPTPLEDLLSAVEQQGRHLDFAPSDAVPPSTLPDTNPPSVLAPKTAAPAPPNVIPQLDVADLLQSYVEHHHSLLGLDWATIGAGEFWMGSDPQQDIHHFEDELPQLRLHLPEFRISRAPITNAQYKAFVDATCYRLPSHWVAGEIPAAKEHHPVVNVSWRDALAFCDWAGVRLPTEAEWEKAARGPDGRIYPWGNTPPTATLCNFDRPLGATTAVGAYPAGASVYGVLDMVGNVWEWTATLWLDSYENYVQELDKQTDRHLRRVLRGGGFRDVEFVRCAARSWDLLHQRYRDLGFRVVALSPAHHPRPAKL